MKVFVCFQFLQTQLVAVIICLELLSFVQTYSLNVGAAPTENNPIETELHFGFKTENGQYRTEDITFNNTGSADSGVGVNGVPTHDNNNQKVKPVEYRGGYSFISADGYKYTVIYKAGKKGFQPYVTAHKITKTE